MMEQDQVVAALSSSTTEVFATMLNLKVAIGAPRKEVDAPGPSEGIIAVIGLAGAWVGTASLSCDTATAYLLASSMLGAEYTEVSEDVLDALSEIATMIFGNFKTAAEPYLGALGLSIPTVIYGLSFSARTAGKEQWIVLPFVCQGHSAEVKVCLVPNRGLTYLRRRAFGEPSAIAAA
jgi:CheY-specific phosphatase CheX